MSRADEEQRREFSVSDPEIAGMRVDRYIADHLALLSRSQLKQRGTELTINGKPAKWSHHLAVGDVVRLGWHRQASPSVVPEAIELDVLFENDEVVVVNKPQGMVVHPAAGNFSGTLVQGLAYRSPEGREELSADNPRPGIVHRLDKDTSGVIITAKNPEARRFLANQFEKKHTAKVYLAIVKGLVIPRRDRIESLITRDPKNRKRFTTSDEEGKAASTDYTVLKQWEQYAFVALRPATGRTHQLRVHLASRGHPIVGDPIYARRDSRFPDATLMLHAHRLRIMLPRRVDDPADASGFHYAGGPTVQFRARLPERFRRLIRELAQ